MAHILKKIGKTVNVPCFTFECDSETDLVNIDVKGVPMGSRCYVINSGESYALNSQGQWKLIPLASGSSDPSDPEPDEIIYDGGRE